MRKDRGRIVDVEVEGILAGMLAGALLLLCETLVAIATGAGALEPLRYVASVWMRERAFEAPVFWVVVAGVSIHLALCAICGFAYGLVATEERVGTRLDRKMQALLGAIAGLAVWVLGFLVLAPFFYPWMAKANPLPQLVLHIGAFGVPMGLFFAELEERRRGETRTTTPR